MNDLPVDWRIVRLADVLSEPLVNGRSPRLGGDGLPVLRMTALRAETVDFTQSKSSDRGDDSALLLAERGDLLVGRVNGSLSLVGEGALVDEPRPHGHPRHHDPSAGASRCGRSALPRTPVEVAGHAAPDRGTRPPGRRSDLPDQPAGSGRGPAAAARPGGTAPDHWPVGGPPRPHRRHHDPYRQRPRPGRRPDPHPDRAGRARRPIRHRGPAPGRRRR
ncbi:hypothetical protein NKH18_07545 [Streptomyces sp. M10(2022)]